MALFLKDLADLWRFSLAEDDNILTPLLQVKLRRALSSPYSRPIRFKTEDSLVTKDKNKFQVHLDVHHFSPKEISVKATGEDIVTVEGKHEERQDEHGWISRHFVRRYKVPKGHDLTKCVSKLSSDGILSITIPKTIKEKQEMDIPITFTNQPSGAARKPIGDVQENGGVCQNCDK